MINSLLYCSVAVMEFIIFVFWLPPNSFYTFCLIPNKIKHVYDVHDTIYGNTFKFIIINNKQIEYNIKGIYNISKPKQTEGKLDSKQSKFCD